MMREAGIEAFVFVSASGQEAGINIALFRPSALAGTRPVFQDAWLCELTADHVRFCAAHGRQIHDFPPRPFLVNGGLPWPA